MQEVTTGTWDKLVLGWIFICAMSQIFDWLSQYKSRGQVSTSWESAGFFDVPTWSLSNAKTIYREKQKKGKFRAKFQQYALAHKMTLGVSGCPRMSCSKLTSLLPAAGKFPVPIGGSALFQFNQLPLCSGFGLSCPSCTPEVSWSENSEPSSPFLHVLPYPACPNSAGRGLHPCCLARSCKANRQCLHSWLGTLPARW